MSGYVDEEVTRLLQDDPDGHYMTKPFTMSALTDTVLGALGQPDQSPSSMPVLPPAND
jgi:hypothetical protein